MLPKTTIDRREYFERCHAESERILRRFDIPNPRCGFSVGLGWMPMVERALEKMVAAGWNKELAQVKQKFCQLRIYIDFGGYDDVDNPVKRFFREVVHRIAGLACKINHKLGMKLYELRDSSLLGKWKLNAVGKAVQEAEAECDRICEVCGKEREKKGPRGGWALCNACGQEEELDEETKRARGITK
jgi:hypothetical protein